MDERAEREEVQRAGGFDGQAVFHFFTKRCFGCKIEQLEFRKIFRRGQKNNPEPLSGVSFWLES
jgi:hypothetical protein